MTPVSVLVARHVLDRLKRGVPPPDGLEKLAVGMQPLQERLAHLLAAGGSQRWLAVQSEYGGGKSHFHAFARYQALRAGYAVASLDVNKDDGALHQPQRHLSVLLDTLRSPRPHLASHQGFGPMARAWLEATPRAEAVRILRHCQAVVPSTSAGRDPAEFAFWIDAYATTQAQPVTGQPCYKALLRFLTAEDLIARSAVARFHAYYRLQVIQEWLLATDHCGLLLFIDEVDNVLRLIHGKGHPGCYRTLAWYCSCPSLAHARTVFAATPEVLDRLDHGGADHYLSGLRCQVTVRPEEVAVYQRWLRQLDLNQAKSPASGS